MNEKMNIMYEDKGESQVLNIPWDGGLGTEGSKERLGPGKSGIWGRTEAGHWLGGPG